MKVKHVIPVVIVAFFMLLQNGFLHAQDSVLSRIIFIGDAGEMDDQQKIVLPHAAANIIKGKSAVFYLGDNIYPRGMGLPGSAEEKHTQDIMRSQYTIMRQNGAPVYFIPGNHDWDRMGPLGLAKIKQQGLFLQAQHDSLLKLVPPNGCPDPIEINVNDSLVVIAFDSEWWLFRYDKKNTDGGCSCSTKEEVLSSFQQLYLKNKGKVILLAMHHPFQSYGTHGGYFPLKDHLFPLTALKSWLYVPLPIIGSLYPLARKSFKHPEDVNHPWYQEMVARIDSIFNGYPNVLHISGHEHGLQLIKYPNKPMQIVSGGGAKKNHTIKGKYSLFGKAIQGYVIADFLPANNIRFTFYQLADSSVKVAYVYDWKYSSTH
jgi:hypothetical protein